MTRKSTAQAPIEPSGVRPAVILALDDDPGRVSVHTPRGPVTARLALASPYRPTEGDRVLVAGGPDELYVIGVLCAATPPRLALPDGGSAEIRGDAVELRDPEGRLVVRYANGSAEIAAPSGDLTLAAPEGRVIIRSGRGVELGAGDAAPQVCVEPAETRVTAARLSVNAAVAEVKAGEATVLARRIATTASALTQTVERFELHATRLLESTRDAFRDVSGLSQTRAGRVRTIVKEAFALYSKRTAMASKEETSIDGSKVLLG